MPAGAALAGGHFTEAAGVDHCTVWHRSADGYFAVVLGGLEPVGQQTMRGSVQVTVYASAGDMIAGINPVLQARSESGEGWPKGYEAQVTCY